MVHPLDRAGLRIAEKLVGSLVSEISRRTFLRDCPAANNVLSGRMTDVASPIARFAVGPKVFDNFACSVAWEEIDTRHC